MKTWLKAALWLGIIGIILCIVGLVCGSTLNLNYLKDKIDIDWDKEITQEISNNDIKDLNIKIDAGKVKIKTGDSFKVECKKAVIDVNEKDNALYIESKNIINFLGKNNQEIVIYVPSDYEFQNVSLEIGAGVAVINDVKCDTTEIECGAGQIEGNISVNNIDIDCGAGKVELKVEGNKNEYNYDLDVGIGQIEVGDVTIGGSGDKKVKNTEENRNIKIDCGTGKVNVKFSK